MRVVGTRHCLARHGCGAAVSCAGISATARRGAARTSAVVHSRTRWAVGATWCDALVRCGLLRTRWGVCFTNASTHVRVARLYHWHTATRCALHTAATVPASFATSATARVHRRMLYCTRACTVQHTHVTAGQRGGACDRTGAASPSVSAVDGDAPPMAPPTARDPRPASCATSTDIHGGLNQCSAVVGTRVHV